jgi:hypothetical protein
LEALLKEKGYNCTIPIPSYNLEVGGVDGNILVDPQGCGAAWALSAIEDSCVQLGCPLPLPKLTKPPVRQRIGLHMKKCFLWKQTPLRPRKDVVIPGRVGKRYFLTDNGELYDMCPKTPTVYQKSELSNTQVVSRVLTDSGETVVGFFELLDESGTIVVSHNCYRKVHKLWLFSPSGRRLLRGPKIRAGRGSPAPDPARIWVMFSEYGRSMLIYDGRITVVRFINNYNQSVIQRSAQDFYVHELRRRERANLPSNEWVWYQVLGFCGNDFLYWSSQPYNKESRIVDSTTVGQVGNVYIAEAFIDDTDCHRLTFVAFIFRIAASGKRFSVWTQ